MPSYLAPGVFVEHVPGGARPIAAVGTSTAALFGRAPDPEAALRRPTAVTGFAEFARLFCAAEAAGGSTLATAVAGFFANGGSHLHVVNLGPGRDPIAPADLMLLDAIEDISLVAAPGFADPASHDALIADCERRGDRFAVLDTPEDIDPLERPTRAAALDDTGPSAGLRPRQSDRGFAAIYTPWIVTRDALSGERAVQPPSGHLLGLYSRSDAERGVHKAPANMALAGALDLSRAISATEQELLNPVGVNCIRRFNQGIRVWGARTLADPASEWRYVPVRRLLTMIGQSLERGTRWVVFEPNDIRLWKALKRDIGAFLHTLWRDGALAGATADQAFFVKCDAETTTQADIDAGRVVALIGVAAVRPAEFVILRLGQSVTDAGVEEGRQ